MMSRLGTAGPTPSTNHTGSGAEPISFDTEREKEERIDDGSYGVFQTRTVAFSVNYSLVLCTSKRHKVIGLITKRLPKPLGFDNIVIERASKELNRFSCTKEGFMKIIR